MLTVTRTYLLLALLILTGLGCLRNLETDPDAGVLRVTPNPIDMRQNLFSGSVTVRFTNVGFDTLFIQSISFNNNAFHTNSQSFSLAPDNGRNVAIGFNYEAYNGVGGVRMLVEIRGQPAKEVDIQTPFKRVLRNISNHPSNNYGVDISPNGNRILFYSDRTGTYDIFSANENGQALLQITDDAYQNIPIGYLPNDNDNILFRSNRSGIMQGYIMNVRTGNITQVTDTEVPSFPVTYSNDRMRLLYYTENPDGTRDSWLRNFETGQIFRLNREDRDRNFDKYTPVAFIESQTRILLRADIGMKTKMFVVRPDGEALFNILDDEWNYVPVAWSERQLRIVMFSNRELRRNIYTIRADGSNLMEVVNSPRLDFPVALSNDSELILYYSNRDDGLDVFFSTFSGSANDRVTAHPYDDIPVTFGPDNNTILFNSDRNTFNGRRYTQVYTTIARPN